MGGVGVCLTVGYLHLPTAWFSSISVKVPAADDHARASDGPSLRAWLPHDTRLAGIGPACMHLERIVDAGAEIVEASLKCV